MSYFIHMFISKAKVLDVTISNEQKATECGEKLPELKKLTRLVKLSFETTEHCSFEGLYTKLCNLSNECKLEVHALRN